MSLLAIVDGEKVRATPGAHGHCPGCGEAMVAKCGQIITWHWSHEAGSGCDPWRLGETEWHLDWKDRFLAAGALVEEPIERDGQRHIADVVINGLVVELAATYPPADQIPQRERFYGRRMAWLYQATWLDRVEQYAKGHELRFRWKQPVKSAALHRRAVYWHDPARDVVAHVPWVRRYADEDTYGDVVHRTYGRLGEWRPAPDFIQAMCQRGQLLS